MGPADYKMSVECTIAVEIDNTLMQQVDKIFS